MDSNPENLCRELMQCLKKGTKKQKKRHFLAKRSSEKYCQNTYKNTYKIWACFFLFFFVIENANKQKSNSNNFVTMFSEYCKNYPH